MSRKHTLLAAAAVIALSDAATAQTAQQNNAKPKMMDKVKGAVESVTGSPMAAVDTDMRHVLDALNGLGPKPLPKLSATEARQQPSAADAAQDALRRQGKSSLPDASVSAKNILVDGAR